MARAKKKIVVPTYPEDAIHITLHSCVINGGDGSAYARYYRTNEEAEKADENQQEYGGFAESATQSLELIVDRATGAILNGDRIFAKINLETGDEED